MLGSAVAVSPQAFVTAANGKDAYRAALMLRLPYLGSALQHYAAARGWSEAQLAEELTAHRFPASVQDVAAMYRGQFPSGRIELEDAGRVCRLCGALGAVMQLSSKDGKGMTPPSIIESANVLKAELEMVYAPAHQLNYYNIFPEEKGAVTARR